MRLRLQHRVDPFGDIHAVPTRGTLMGNRGGCLHDHRRQLGRRRWVSRHWIAGVLAFNGRHRTVMTPGRYTELFFLDEATALAAGHRPCFESRWPEARAFAIRCRPGLRLTIDHLGGKGGNTTLKDAAAMTHMPALLALAKHPNVAVKVTGAPGYSSEAYPFPAMHTFVRQIYDAFDPQRMFWGTDITKMPCSWRQCVTLFTEELPWLSELDKALIMGQAVWTWWDWDRPV